MDVQMRATQNRLQEKFLLPIARELAAGLNAIHEAGIIHRDVKCKYPLPLLRFRQLERKNKVKRIEADKDRIQQLRMS